MILIAGGMTLRVIDHGPYCGDIIGIPKKVKCMYIKMFSVNRYRMKNVPETKCLDAAMNFLGFQDSDQKLQVGNWSSTPPGCYVGHKNDQYTKVYFNR